MIETDLFLLVLRAKSGDKEALSSIITMFHPIIKKNSQRAGPNEQSDLQQHLSEMIIRAVLRYDMNTIPDYSAFIESINFE
ncbi:RNA polymerase sporulation-specific sigma factor [Paenibacillus castaneae]|uniref:helix-turn-helix domain-containing protein n=1 Tax=Paenibacillus castaneae TaxID=474957 RepID=UPI000C9A3F83|nr:helix-turn-helix domain-containing protein [Paenibacillus castaneae]NIK78801.1 RNA polymerase sporulation-specific sigma factor [Paenibacillus castaneae]